MLGYLTHKSLLSRKDVGQRNSSAMIRMDKGRVWDKTMYLVSEP